MPTVLRLTYWTVAFTSPSSNSSRVIMVIFGLMTLVKVKMHLLPTTAMNSIELLLFFYKIKQKIPKPKILKITGNVINSLC